MKMSIKLKVFIYSSIIFAFFENYFSDKIGCENPPMIQQNCKLHKFSFMSSCQTLQKVNLKSAIVSDKISQ